MAVVLASPTCLAEILKPIETTQNSGPVSKPLQNFLEVAMKVAQIDEAIINARACPPVQDDSEAFKWHEVSIKALMWTRTSLIEQQSNALGQLKSSVLSQKTPVIHSWEAAPALLASAAPFSPVPLKSIVGAGVKPSKALTPAQVGAKVATGEMSVGSLRDDLERLKEYDSQQCLIVRRIKRLGLSSPEILRDHFSGFGRVAEMLISHSFEKKSAKCRSDRVRPAALGFIVMESVEGAQAALQAGPTLLVGDVDIEVNKFEPLDVLQQKESLEIKPIGLKSFQ